MAVSARVTQLFNCQLLTFPRYIVINNLNLKQKKHILYKCSCLNIRSISSSYDRNYSIRSNRLEKRRQKILVSKILRVDHAGELGANRIYQGQMAVLGATNYGPIIKEMWEQEKEHIAKFEELLPKYKTRPTALMPLWNIAGFMLGAGTALLGKEAAMACTIAVEEVIGGHYDNQLRELLREDPEKYRELLEVIQKFRDDELEHMNLGYHYDGEKVISFS